MAEGNATPLPQWQSHKKVRGDKIVEVRDVGLGNRESGTDSGQRWVLACGAIITVSLDLMARPAGQDPLGGYYALYEDGFESWSPEQAWINGYTRIINPETIDPTR